MSDHGVPALRRHRGRPRGGDSGARDRIIDAAVLEFGEKGYDGATIRSIAARAGVDPALVHHYFGAKADLFTGVIGAPMQPARAIPELLAPGLEGAGARIVRFVLQTWDDPRFRTRGVAIMRAMIGNRKTTGLMVAFVSREILRRIAHAIGDGPDARRRAGLAASQIVGLIVTRYVLEVPGIADAPTEEVVDAVGPSVQRYLTGELSPVDDAGA